MNLKHNAAALMTKLIQTIELKIQYFSGLCRSLKNPTYLAALNIPGLFSYNVIYLRIGPTEVNKKTDTEKKLLGLQQAHASLHAFLSCSSFDETHFLKTPFFPCKE